MPVVRCKEKRPQSLPESQRYPATMRNKKIRMIAATLTSPAVPLNESVEASAFWDLARGSARPPDWGGNPAPFEHLMGVSCSALHPHKLHPVRTLQLWMHPTCVIGGDK